MLCVLGHIMALMMVGYVWEERIGWMDGWWLIVVVVMGDSKRSPGVLYLKIPVAVTDEKVRCDTMMMFELAMDKNSVCPKTSSNVPMGKKEKERREGGRGKNLLEKVPVEIYSKSYLKIFVQNLKQLLF
ncbi:unnamed protein product [Onchocerca flexuosa]|uniref:Secreted protein n=1 Tax=Onchocerca flexuosa TaxID=387005 RepID=A0A183HLK4_9BILA|nr:unnamed protein product [Onchocerca flexuosa]